MAKYYTCRYVLDVLWAASARDLAAAKRLCLRPTVDGRHCADHIEFPPKREPAWPLNDDGSPCSPDNHE